MRIGRVRRQPRVPRRAHAPRCPRRSLRRRDPAQACRVAAGDFEGLSRRGDDVDFQRDRKTGNRSRNVPPAPSVGGFLSAGVARTLGSKSPSRRTDLACPATPSPGMQDDSVTRNLLVPARPGGGSRSEVALSKNPKTARRSRVAPAERRPRPRHSRAKANGTPCPQRPRPCGAERPSQVKEPFLSSCAFLRRAAPSAPPSFARCSPDLARSANK